MITGDIFWPTNPKAGIDWVVVVATSTANPAVASESSRGSDCVFSNCFGKAEKKGGGEGEAAVVFSLLL